jgi:hypothetical protein
MSLDSSVSIVTRLSAGSQGNWGLIPGRGRDFSLLHNIQTSSGVHTGSYTEVTGEGGYFPINKPV